jgi:hypothetical protein
MKEGRRGGGVRLVRKRERERKWEKREEEGVGGERERGQKRGEIERE